MNKEDKKEIKELINKEIKDKEDKQSFYSLFFIAFTIFFASLIQLLIYYYSNSDFMIPLFGKIVIVIVVLTSMLVIYYLLSDILDRLKIRKNKYLHYLLFAALALIISLIYLFIMYGAPKSQLMYGFTCPQYLEYESNISLSVENKGETISSFQFYSRAIPKLVFVHLRELNESLPENFRIFPKGSNTFKYRVYFNSYENITNITIDNFFDCFPKSKIDCVLTNTDYNEDKCVYVKDGSKYKKKTKTIFINLD